MSSDNVVTVIITPTQGASITEKVPVPPEGMTIAQIMGKLGRDPGRLNFSVSAEPSTTVRPGSTIAAAEPVPAATSQVVRPGGTVKGAERPAGS